METSSSWMPAGLGGRPAHVGPSDLIYADAILILVEGRKVMNGCRLSIIGVSGLESRIYRTKQYVCC